MSDENIVLSIYLPESLKIELEKRAELEGRTLTNYIRSVLLVQAYGCLGPTGATGPRGPQGMTGPTTGGSENGDSVRVCSNSKTHGARGKGTDRHK
jgi:hypothetical protein